MASTPERDFSPVPPPSARRVAAEALLGLSSDSIVARIPSSVRRSERVAKPTVRFEFSPVPSPPEAMPRAASKTAAQKAAAAKQAAAAKTPPTAAKKAAAAKKSNVAALSAAEQARKDAADFEAKQAMQMKRANERAKKRAASKARPARPQKRARAPSVHEDEVDDQDEVEEQVEEQVEEEVEEEVADSEGEESVQELESVDLTAQELDVELERDWSIENEVALPLQLLWKFACLPERKNDCKMAVAPDAEEFEVVDVPAALPLAIRHAIEAKMPYAIKKANVYVDGHGLQAIHAFTAVKLLIPRKTVRGKDDSLREFLVMPADATTDTFREISHEICKIMKRKGVAPYRIDLTVNLDISLKPRAPRGRADFLRRAESTPFGTPGQGARTPSVRAPSTPTPTPYRSPFEAGNGNTPATGRSKGRQQLECLANQVMSGGLEAETDCVEEAEPELTPMQLQVAKQVAERDDNRAALQAQKGANFDLLSGRYRCAVLPGGKACEEHKSRKTDNYCYREHNGEHTKITWNELLLWCDKIKNGQEYASIDNIPSSLHATIRDNKVLRLNPQARVSSLMGGGSSRGSRSNGSDDGTVGDPEGFQQYLSGAEQRAGKYKRGGQTVVNTIVPVTVHQNAPPPPQQQQWMCPPGYMMVPQQMAPPQLPSMYHPGIPPTPPSSYLGQAEPQLPSRVATMPSRAGTPPPPVIDLTVILSSSPAAAPAYVDIDTVEWQKQFWRRLCRDPKEGGLKVRSTAERGHLLRIRGLMGDKPLSQIGHVRNEWYEDRDVPYGFAGEIRQFLKQFIAGIGGDVTLAGDLHQPPPKAISISERSDRSRARQLVNERELQVFLDDLSEERLHHDGPSQSLGGQEEETQPDAQERFV